LGDRNGFESKSFSFSFLPISLRVLCPGRKKKTENFFARLKKVQFTLLARVSLRISKLKKKCNNSTKNPLEQAGVANLFLKWANI
jgi:hypothetical protein